jgi:hypothetical protein
MLENFHIKNLDLGRCTFWSILPCLDLIAIVGLAWWPFFETQNSEFLFVVNGNTNPWLSLSILYYIILYYKHSTCLIYIINFICDYRLGIKTWKGCKWKMLGETIGGKNCETRFAICITFSNSFDYTLILD